MKTPCPVCGNKVESLIQGRCADCFAQFHSLISFTKPLEVTVCKFCGKAKNLSRFETLDDASLRERVLASLKIEGEKPEVNVTIHEAEKGWVGMIDLHTTFGGKAVHQEMPFVIPKNVVVCDACMKLKSDYFEGTVQIRFLEKKNLLDEKALIEKSDHFLKSHFADDPLLVLISTRREKGGFDLIIGSKKAAKDLAHFLAKTNRSQVISTSSLVGIKSGKAKKRFTFCVRL